MSYTRTTWIARVGTALNRFLKTNETSTEVELTADPTGVTTAGTPFTVANMNKIEQGIYDAHYPEFTEAATLTNIASGEVGTTLWGKVKKAISAVITHDGYLNQGVKTTDSPTFANFAGKVLNAGTGVDLDDVIISGFYYIPSDALNSPISSCCSLTVSRNSDIISQTLIPADQDYFYYRSGNPTEVGGIGSWRAWKQVTQSDQNLRTTDSVHFANMNPPVDNNDSTPPTIGMGGFTFATAGTGAGILAPSGGTHMYLRMTNSGVIRGCGRIAGGSATPTGTGAGTDYAYFWRLA